MNAAVRNVPDIEKVKTRFWEVANTTYVELLTQMAQWAEERQSRIAKGERGEKVDGQKLICFCDGNGMPKAYFGDKELCAAYASADVVCPDGVSVKYLAMIDGGKLPRSVIGPDLFWQALLYGVERGWRHYFYGASASTLAALKARAEAAIPGVKIVGTFSPEYAADPAVPPSDCDCDFFWVALGCPKQEKWCARHLAELEAAVVLPVGAAFDFYAGTAPKTPDWIVRAGFCWLWRLTTGGPRVAWRNAKCVSLALLALMIEWVRVRYARDTHIG